MLLCITNVTIKMHHAVLITLPTSTYKTSRLCMEKNYTAGDGNLCPIKSNNELSQVFGFRCLWITIFRGLHYSNNNSLLPYIFLLNVPSLSFLLLNKKMQKSLEQESSPYDQMYPITWSEPAQSLACSRTIGDTFPPEAGGGGEGSGTKIL